MFSLGADSLKIMKDQDKNITNLLLNPLPNLGKTLIDMMARHNGQLARLLSLARDNDTVALEFVKIYKNSTKPQFLNVTQRIQSKLVDWRGQFKLTPIQTHDIRDLVYECRTIWSQYKRLQFADGLLKPEKLPSEEDYTSSEYSGFGYVCYILKFTNTF